MKNCLQFQFRLLFTQKAFLFTLIGMCVYSCMAFLINLFPFVGETITQVNAAYQFYLGSRMSNATFSIFSVLLPIAAALPFADSYFKERKQNTTCILLSKMSAQQYFASKWVAVFFSGVVVAAVPLLLNFCLNFIVFPVKSYGIEFSNLPASAEYVYRSGSFFSEITAWKRLLFKQPYLYNLLYLVLSSLLAGCYALLVYNLSFFIKKQHFLLLASTFILCNVMIALTSFTNIPIGLENYAYAFVRLGEWDPVIFALNVLFYAAMLFIPIPFCIKKLKDDVT